MAFSFLVLPRTKPWFASRPDSSLTEPLSSYYLTYTHKYIYIYIRTERGNGKRPKESGSLEIKSPGHARAAVPGDPSSGRKEGARAREVIRPRKLSFCSLTNPVSINRKYTRGIRSCKGRRRNSLTVPTAEGRHQ